nr:hypothetical protein [Streptomyces sp. R527F]
MPDGTVHRVREVRFGDRPDAHVGPGLGGRTDVLVRLPVHIREHGPQGLVPGDYIAQRGPQGVGVQSAGQPQHDRHVVRRAGALQPVEEPQAALREGQRHRLLTHQGHQRRTVGRARHRLHHTRQSGNRRRREQIPDHQVRTQHRPDPPDQTHRQQRMPTQLEEPLLHTHPIKTQNLREQPRQNLLTRITRNPRQHRTAVIRSRQRLTIQLPVRRQRQSLHNHHSRGHHVLRQPHGNSFPHPARLHRTIRHDITDQAPVPGPVLTDHGHSSSHTRARRQHSLDLTEFDAETTQL